MYRIEVYNEDGTVALIFPGSWTQVWRLMNLFTHIGHGPIYIYKESNG